MTTSSVLCPVVLAGGSGTRLWPLSRELYPKQFLPLTGEKTMLQHVLERVGDLPHDPPIILCNHEYRFIVTEQCRQSDMEPQAVILEPERRNTAPAAALAALHATREGDDPLMLVLPADNLIASAEGFRAAVESALPFAEAGHIMLFGIKPLRPDPAYGYILPGAAVESGSDVAEIQTFVEKPQPEKAQQYLDAGPCYWNSGIFLFRASVYLSELKAFRPDILQACEAAAAEESVDLELFRRPGPAFATCPSESIDRAVMEQTQKVRVVPADMGWTDLGSWNAAKEAEPGDEHGNATRGDVLTVECKDSYLRSENRLLAAIGLEKLVVVETADAVLVADRDHAADVGLLVDGLRERARDEARVHAVTRRPWGQWQVTDRGPGFLVKRLTVYSGATLSLQLHHHRAEHWVVVSGVAQVQCGDEHLTLQAGESIWIPVETRHRLANSGPELLELIEVQTGDWLSEDDIERFEDDYGRV